jgi:hypothetical protein
MKKYILKSAETILFLIVFVSCVPAPPSESFIQTAIAQTQESDYQIATNQESAIRTLEKSFTSTATNTPKSTNTPTNTPTATLTKTPKPTATPYVPRWLREVDNPINKMAIKKDDFTGYTWYQDKSSPNYTNVNGFYIYFGEKGGNQTLHLVIQYHGNGWLFIESYAILVDKKIKNIDANYFDINRDMRGLGVSEWYDLVLGQREILIIEAIIKSEESIIRYSGKQYYDERIITNEEKQALKNVLAAFEECGGRLDLP